MRCDQCEHWKDRIDWEASAVGFRLCGAVRPRWVIQDEVPVAYSPGIESPYITSRREALAGARAYVQDSSGYRAELMTGPDFGCVLFAPASGTKSKAPD